MFGLDKKLEKLKELKEKPQFRKAVNQTRQQSQDASGTNVSTTPRTEKQASFGQSSNKNSIKNSVKDLGGDATGDALDAITVSSNGSAVGEAEAGASATGRACRYTPTIVSVHDFIKFLQENGYVQERDIRRAEALARQHGSTVLDILALLDTLKLNTLIEAIVKYVGTVIKDTGRFPFRILELSDDAIKSVMADIESPDTVIMSGESNELDAQGVFGVLLYRSKRNVVNAVIPAEGAFRSIRVLAEQAIAGRLRLETCYLASPAAYWKVFTAIERKVCEQSIIRMLSAGTSEFNARVFIETLIKHAAASGATDIHFGLFSRGNTEAVLIRYRIDGILYPMFVLSRELYDKSDLGNVINVVIEMCGGSGKWQRGTPYDGRIGVPWRQTSNIDVRVSIIPNVRSYSTVFRILISRGQVMGEVTLGALGFHPQQEEAYGLATVSLSGVVIVAGPTGAGKSTTLNAIISKLEKLENNVVTVEDPVEYTLKNARQVQVDAERDVTFSKILRSFLRHDPDIILVGEIRDEETAQMAFQASITGHLVLSTIHARTTYDILTRLYQYNVDPVLIGSALECISTQRLVRCVCPYCSEEVKVPDEVRRMFAKKHSVEVPVSERKGRGCEKCNYTGYLGRTVIAEVIPLKELKGVHASELVNIGEHGLKRACQEAGILTIAEHAAMKISEGITTVEEALRVI